MPSSFEQQNHVTLKHACYNKKFERLARVYDSLYKKNDRLRFHIIKIRRELKALCAVKRNLCSRLASFHDPYQDEILEIRDNNRRDADVEKLIGDVITSTEPLCQPASKRRKIDSRKPLKIKDNKDGQEEPEAREAINRILSAATNVIKQQQLEQEEMIRRRLEHDNQVPNRKPLVKKQTRKVSSDGTTHMSQPARSVEIDFEAGSSHVISASKNSATKKSLLIENPMLPVSTVSGSAEISNLTEGTTALTSVSKPTITHSSYAVVTHHDLPGKGPPLQKQIVERYATQPSRYISKAVHIQSYPSSDSNPMAMRTVQSGQHDSALTNSSTTPVFNTQASQSTTSRIIEVDDAKSEPVELNNAVPISNSDQYDKDAVRLFYKKRNIDFKQDPNNPQLLPHRQLNLRKIQMQMNQIQPSGDNSIHYTNEARDLQNVRTGYTATNTDNMHNQATEQKPGTIFPAFDNNDTWSQLRQQNSKSPTVVSQLPQFSNYRVAHSVQKQDQQNPTQLPMVIQQPNQELPIQRNSSQSQPKLREALQNATVDTHQVVQQQLPQVQLVQTIPVSSQGSIAQWTSVNGSIRQGNPHMHAQVIPISQSGNVIYIDQSRYIRFNSDQMIQMPFSVGAPTVRYILPQNISSVSIASQKHKKSSEPPPSRLNDDNIDWSVYEEPKPKPTKKINSPRKRISTIKVDSHSEAMARISPILAKFQQEMAESTIAQEQQLQQEKAMIGKKRISSKSKKRPLVSEAPTIVLSSSAQCGDRKAVDTSKGSMATSTSEFAVSSNADKRASDYLTVAPMAEKSDGIPSIIVTAATPETANSKSATEEHSSENSAHSEQRVYAEMNSTISSSSQ